MAHAKPTVSPVKPNTSNATSASDKAAAGEKAANANVPAAKPRLAFPLLLTVVAVLPVAIGVGAVRLKASAASVKPNLICSVSDADSQESNLVFLEADRRAGDELFMKRQYDIALRKYQSLGSGNVNRLPPELLYRIALCEEALGRWNEALEHQRIVANVEIQPGLKAASLFGQARVCLRMNEHSKSASLFRYLILQSESQNTIPANMSREIAFLFPLALAKSTTADVRFADRVDPARWNQFFDGSLEIALDWVDEHRGNVSSEPAADSPENACYVQRHPTTTDHVGEVPLESQVVKVCFRGQTLGTIVQRIADECGWTIDWTDMAQDPSLDRIVTLMSDDQPLCLTLTIIGSELQATWTVTDECLVIARSRSNGEDTRGMIAQSLISLTKWIPKHRYVDESRFALAEIAQSECCLEAAAKLFGALAVSKSSSLAIRAAANAADNYYRLKDYASACAQLNHVVDGAPGSKLQAESQVLLGRLLLELGQPQEAIFQLRRATDVNNSHEIQAHASILLGLAYLLQEKYPEAAEAVFVRKFQFEEPEVRNMAAFVTALSRWHYTTGDTRERESSYLYRSLISVNPDLEWPGQSARLLIGRAYLDLGFGEKMAEMYSKTLSGNAADYIRDEMTYTLANYEMENDHPDLAKQMWWKLSIGHSKRLANRSRLRLAAIALIEERPRDCLEICELIRADEEISVSDIQKLMGHAFEQLGEDTLAARCYAGQYKVK